MPCVPVEYVGSLPFTYVHLNKLCPTRELMHLEGVLLCVEVRNRWNGDLLSNESKNTMTFDDYIPTSNRDENVQEKANINVIYLRIEETSLMDGTR